MTLAHESLANVMTTNTRLIRANLFSLGEIGDMIPWEREIYIALVIQQIEEEKRNTHG